MVFKPGETDCLSVFQSILCDPQTSGGLLVAVGKESEAELLAIAAQAGLTLSPIGQLQARTGNQFIEVVQ